MEPPIGFEPTIFALQKRRFTVKLQGQNEFPLTALRGRFSVILSKTPQRVAPRCEL